MYRLNAALFGSKCALAIVVKGKNQSPFPQQGEASYTVRNRLWGRTVGLMRWLRIATGVVFLVVGLLGWLLPIIPGWAFIIPGLVLLSREFSWAKGTLQWLKRRFPQKSAQD